MSSPVALKKCAFFVQACKNKEFLDSIESNTPNEFYDWRTTVVFYSALHQIKSFAATKGITTESHKDTFEKMYSQGKGMSPQLVMDSKVVSSYSKLYKLSHTCRYEGFVMVNSVRKVAKSRLKDAKEYLDIIENWIIPELQKAGIDTTA